MKRLLITILPLMLAAGCQTMTSDQAYQARYGSSQCKDRAYDAGLCYQPSNFNLFGTVVSGELQSD